MDDSLACIDNPPNCIVAADSTGECTKTHVGYYFDTVNFSVEPCASVIDNCNECLFLGSAASCTVCKGNGTLSLSQPGTCEAPVCPF